MPDGGISPVGRTMPVGKVIANGRGNAGWQNAMTGGRMAEDRREGVLREA